MAQSLNYTRRLPSSFTQEISCQFSSGRKDYSSRVESSLVIPEHAHDSLFALEHEEQSATPSDIISIADLVQLYGYEGVWNLKFTVCLFEPMCRLNLFIIKVKCFWSFHIKTFLIAEIRARWELCLSFNQVFLLSLNFHWIN
jgi:hypothetical protein